MPSLPAVAASCACWIAGFPESQQTTARAMRDALGSVRWATVEDLWLPLPTWPATLVVELRLGTEQDGAKRVSSLTCGVAYSELDEANVRCDATWLRVEGTGPLRSDGERLGSAELLVAHSVHAQRGYFNESPPPPGPLLASTAERAGSGKQLGSSSTASSSSRSSPVPVASDEQAASSNSMRRHRDGAHRDGAGFPLHVSEKAHRDFALYYTLVKQRQVSRRRRTECWPTRAASAVASAAASAVATASAPRPPPLRAPCSCLWRAPGLCWRCAAPRLLMLCGRRPLSPRSAGGG